MAECDGVLYAAAGLEEAPDGCLSGGLYRRLDGTAPRWELVYRWPYTALDQGDEANIMRGLTAVPDPLGGPHRVLLGTRTRPGVVERIDPGRNHEVTVEFDIRSHYEALWGVSDYEGAALSAYNRFVPATDPESGEPVHLIGLWVNHPSALSPPYNGSRFLVRRADATYESAEIFDYLHPVPSGQSLRGARALEVSPFPEDQGRAFYAGGYDCAGIPSHNTAWIYRGTLAGGVLSASASAAPSAGGAPLSVAFEAEISGGTPPYSFDWDFGDGSAHAVEKDPSHTYTQTGRYEAVLAVADSAGASARAAVRIDVYAAPGVTSVAAASNPFRLKVSGSGFEPGCTVRIDGVPAPQTVFKNAGLLVAKGSGLKAMVARGVTVQVTVVSPDGRSSEPYPFQR
jgi:hypothetical protein